MSRIKESLACIPIIVLSSMWEGKRRATFLEFNFGPPSSGICKDIPISSSTNCFCPVEDGLA